MPMARFVQRSFCIDWLIWRIRGWDGQDRETDTVDRACTQGVRLHTGKTLVLKGWENFAVALQTIQVLQLAPDDKPDEVVQAQGNHALPMSR